MGPDVKSGVAEHETRVIKSWYPTSSAHRGGKNSLCVMVGRYLYSHVLNVLCGVCYACSFIPSLYQLSPDVTGRLAHEECN